MAWAKKALTKIGTGEAVELTVSNGNFEFTGAVNLSIQSEVDDFISKAKTSYAEKQESISDEADLDPAVQNILSTLNG